MPSSSSGAASSAIDIARPWRGASTDIARPSPFHTSCRVATLAIAIVPKLLAEKESLVTRASSVSSVMF